MKTIVISFLTLLVGITSLSAAPEDEINGLLKYVSSLEGATFTRNVLASGASGKRQRTPISDALAESTGSVRELPGRTNRAGDGILVPNSRSLSQCHPMQEMREKWQSSQQEFEG